MRRLLSLLLLWVGLIGAGAPAFACTTAAAAGDCCPPGRASGCTEVYAQLGSDAIVCCISAAASSALVTVEPGREPQLAHCERGSADPIATAASAHAILDVRGSNLVLPVITAARTDSSLTYLHTARLRL